MPTVVREDGFVVKVWGPPREHAPPHVHVEKHPEGLVVIRLALPNKPQRVWEYYNVSKRDIINAFRLVESMRTRFGGNGRSSMAKRSLSNREILAQLPAAKRRSTTALAKRARAEAVHVDADGRLLTVALTNGSRFSVPTRRVPGLERASIAALQRVTIDPGGMGIHWADLDVDHSVSGLARVVLGETNLLAAAGAAGGRATSNAKAEAARRNGKKGGRPRVKTRSSRTS